LSFNIIITLFYFILLNLHVEGRLSQQVVLEVPLLQQWPCYHL